MHLNMNMEAHANAEHSWMQSSLISCILTSLTDLLV